MSVRPRVLGHRVLLAPLEAAEATAGGVILASEVREKESRGMVIAVGECRPGIDPQVDVGDVVVYAEHGSTSFTHPVRVTVDNDEIGKAEQFIVVAFDDLLLVLEEADAA